MVKEAELVQTFQRQHLREIQGTNGAENDSDLEYDEAELLELFDGEESEAMSAYREERRSQLALEFARVKAMAGLKTEAGLVIELDTEKELMELLSAHGNRKDQHNVVCFYLPNFAKCGVMLEKLDGLAAKYLALNFYKLNVLNAPFLVTKLNIKVLPVVLFYNDRGVEVNRIVGFDLLLLPNQKEHDNFSVSALEQQLVRHGMVTYLLDDNGDAVTGETRARKTIRGARDDSDESDLDL